MFTVRQNWFGWFEVLYPKGGPLSFLVRSSHQDRESAEQEAERLNRSSTR